MAHTLIKPTVIAGEALAVLYNSTIFAALVHRDFDKEFGGKQGDTVTIRTPTTFTAHEYDRDAGLTLQNAAESSTDVTLDTILDVSFPITTEDLTLTIDNFRDRFLVPAAEAIVQEIDGVLAELLVDAANTGGGGGVATWSSSKVSNVFVGETGARAKLARAKAPTSNRYAAFSPEAAGKALQEELFVAADKSGWTDALREGALGRVFGFDTYETQGLGYGSGDKGGADGVAWHRDAVALVTRTLEKPMGLPADQMAVENFKGLGLRVVQSYDIDKKQDIVSVDFLYGKKTLRKEHAVELDVQIGS